MSTLLLAGRLGYDELFFEHPATFDLGEIALLLFALMFLVISLTWRTLVSLEDYCYSGCGVFVPPRGEVSFYPTLSPPTASFDVYFDTYSYSSLVDFFVLSYSSTEFTFDSPSTKKSAVFSEFSVSIPFSAAAACFISCF